MLHILLLGVLGFWIGSLNVVFAEVCKECHEDKYSAKFGHYPAQDGACDICHTVKPEHFDDGDARHVKTLTNPEDTCYQCHEKVGEKAFRHGILDLGEQACVACHNSHGSDNRGILKVPTPELCFRCHSSQGMAGQSAHSALNTGRSCATCHNPHSSDNVKLLEKPTTELCLSCHDKPVAAKDRLIPNMKAKIEQPYRMETVTECTNCHFPHASEQYTRLLRSNFPASNYNPYFPGDATRPNTYANCFECHDSAMLNRQMAGTETRFRKDIFLAGAVRHINLHWYHVTNEPTSTGPRFGRSCRICHDIHGSSQEHMIKTDIAPGAPQLKFTQLENGGQCAGSCHNVKVYQRVD